MSPKKYCWFMFIISTLFFFYEFILRVSPNVMTESLRQSFHINAQQLGFMGSVFFQAYALTQIPVGVIFDRFSARKTLALSCLFCASGAILFSSSNFFWLAVSARCLIGIGAAFGFVGSLKIASLWLPERYFTFISGFLFTFGFLGAVFADHLLVTMMRISSWSNSILYLGYFGVVLSVLLYITIKDPTDAVKEQKAIPLKAIICGLIKILKNPLIWLNGFIGFLMYFPTAAFAELFGKSYLETVLGFNSEQAVSAVTYVFIGWAAGGPLMGWLSDRLLKRKIFLVLGSFGAALCIYFVLFAGIKNLFVIDDLSCPVSAAELINFVYSMEVSPQKFSATAIATTNMFVIFGGAFAQAIIGYALDLCWSQQLDSKGMRIYSSQDFKQAFIILPVALVIGGALSLLLKDKIRGAKIMKTIAFLTSPNYNKILQQCPNFLDEFSLLAPIFWEHTIKLTKANWQDPSVDWENFSAVIPKACWDYTDSHSEFEKFIQKITKLGVPFKNSAKLILWNMRKNYLLDLQRLGLPIIDLFLLPKGSTLEEKELKQKIQELASKNSYAKLFIAKPSIGAGGLFLQRFAIENLSENLINFELILQHSDLIIQPYFPEIAQHGEYSYFFKAEEFSHAIVKKPAPGNYLAHSLYGAKNTVYLPTELEITQAKKFIKNLPEKCQYARVDVASRAGQLYLLELELIEPYLYFEHAQKDALNRYCQAIMDPLYEPA